MDLHEVREKPIRILTTGLILTLLIIAGLTWLNFQLYRNYQTQFRRHIELERLQKSVIYLDEVLTMSARLAATTGDASWEKRYRDQLPRLDQALRRTIELAPNPDVLSAIHKVNQSNEKLVLMEDQALRYVKAEKPKQAKDILFSETYETFKQTYSAGISAFGEGVQKLLDKEESSLTSSIRVSLITCLVLLNLLAIAWNYLRNVLTSWARRISGINAELEIMVAHRTQALQQEIEKKNDAETKLAEQQQIIIHSEKMRALGEMAGGIGHEINNPLTAIQLGVGQLNKMVQDNAIQGTPFNPDLIRRITEQLERTTQRISKIIKGLRTFAREGSQDPFQLVNLKQLIEETLELCQERFKLHHVSIFHGDIPTDIILRCQPTQLSQVMLNLLSNAYDAVEKLPEKWVKIAFSETENCYEISITDSGKGVPATIRDKILNPFFTTKPANKGTGLGLSISKGIVENHGGKLALDTRSPQTRFVISLPKTNRSQGSATERSAG